MKSTVPAPAAALLEFISKYESAGNYLAVFGNAKSTKPLPETLGGVLELQSGKLAAGARSTAVGRYEFMQATLKSLAAAYKLLASDAFTPDYQDQLGYYLLERRGYSSWMAGKLDDYTFADNLSKEWASLPYHTGKSYYDGDGLNHSSVQRSVFLAAIAAAKATPATTKEEPMTASTTTTVAPKVDFITGLINTAEHFVSSINSSIEVAVSPNNSITVGGTGSMSNVFASISQAQNAVSELGAIIADAKAGKWANEVEDVMALLKTVFSVLSTFGINVPVLSQVVALMPSLAPVQPPAGTATPTS